VLIAGVLNQIPMPFMEVMNLEAADHHSDVVRSLTARIVTARPEADKR